MNDHQFLYEPINQLKAFGDDLWIVDGPKINMAVYGTHIPFPTRMTIVRFQNKDLWVHSPIPLVPALKQQIDTLGQVRYLVAPNRIHYASIQEWVDAYPAAKAWHAPGVLERAASQKIKVTFHEALDDQVPKEWSSELDQACVRGSRFMDEVVFFHKLSRTLILADLIESFEPHKLPWWLRWGAKAAGCLHPNGRAPIDLRMMYIGRKQEAMPAIEKIKGWHPEKIIIAHGKCFESQGMKVLQRSLAWLGWNKIPDSYPEQAEASTRNG